MKLCKIFLVGPVNDIEHHRCAILAATWIEGNDMSQKPHDLNTLVIEVHLFNHVDSPDITAVLKQGVRIMAALDALTAAVAANSGVVDSAVTLLQGLKQKLDDAIASGDPAAVQNLSDQLGAETQKLADAVAANTPAQP